MQLKPLAHGIKSQLPIHGIAITLHKLLDGAMESRRYADSARVVKMRRDGV
jgi:hypothetical protein